MKPLYPVTAIVLLACLAAPGCVTKPEEQAKKKAADSEYTYVTPLGSRIPVKVRRGESATTASPTNKVSGAEAENLMRSGRGRVGPTGQQ